MFFQGSLQSGIGLAVQAGRDVAVYCYDDEENCFWPEEELLDETIVQYLTTVSVALKVKKSTAEYDQFRAFVPEITLPSIIRIRQGQVVKTYTELEDLLHDAKTWKDSFRPAAESSRPAGNTISPPADTPAHIATPVPTPTIPLPTPSPDPPRPPPPTPASRPSTSTTQTPTRSPPSEDPTPPPPQPGAVPEPPRRAAQQNWAAEQRNRNAEARKERDRVMAQIEADKKARKAADEERKRQRAAESNENRAPVQNHKSSRSTGTTAQIQVRLISGRTIRSSFPATATPTSHLRPFIDEALRNDDEGRVPAYRLKQMSAPPQQAREIALSEENQSLAELGLLPSATLVVTPIHGAVNAYAGAGSGWGLLSLPVSIVSGVAGVAGSALGYVMGGSSSNSGEPNGSSSSTDKKETQQQDQATAKIRTIGQMRAERDADPQQLYNGNQLNFQSDNDTNNKDPDDKKE